MPCNGCAQVVFVVAVGSEIPCRRQVCVKVAKKIMAAWGLMRLGGCGVALLGIAIERVEWRCGGGEERKREEREWGGERRGARAKWEERVESRE